MFANRLIQSASKTTPHLSEASATNSNLVAHLIGVFVMLDTDKDGYLSKIQIIQALQLVGLRPNDSLLNDFARKQTQLNASSGSGAGGSTETSSRKSVKVTHASFKISCAVFVEITSCMINDKSESAVQGNELDLKPLVEFAGSILKDDSVDSNQGISLKTLKHYLVDVETSTSLNEKDFNSFLSTLSDEKLVVDKNEEVADNNNESAHVTVDALNKILTIT
jgi:hypothetical protein